MKNSFAGEISQPPNYILGVSPDSQGIAVIGPLEEPNYSGRTVEHATHPPPASAVVQSLPAELVSSDRANGWTTFVWLVLGLCGVALIAMSIDSIIAVMRM